MSHHDQPAVRSEHDLLGDREVPADAYYGVHTVRAVENFPISGVPISRHSDLVAALASVKQAAAEANQQLVAEAIATGASIPELVRRSARMDDAVLARVLSPENLCRPNDPKALSDTETTPRRQVG